MFQILIIGFIGMVSQLRRTANGKAVVNFSVAENTANGTVWHRCVAWGAQAEAVAKHLSAGSYVTVQANKAVTKVFTTKDGKPAASVEFWASRVVFGPKGNKVGRESTPDVSVDAPPTEADPFA